MAFTKDPSELGALWQKNSAKGPYMTGTINGVQVVCFRAKPTSDKAPDWRVYKSKPRDGAPARETIPPPTDDEVGF